VELAASVEEGTETVFDIKHTAPQHRQYLEYGVCIHALLYHSAALEPHSYQVSSKSDLT